MIGIAIVVVLLVIGATIFLTLSIKPASTAHEAFTQKEVAQNMVDALVKTTTHCRGLDFASILEDCAKNAENGLLCEDGQRSCEYARNAITDILYRTLTIRNYEYRFSATRDDRTTIFDDITTTGCTKEMIQQGSVTVETPGIQPIPLYPGTVTLMLQICSEIR